MDSRRPIPSSLSKQKSDDFAPDDDDDSVEEEDENYASEFGISSEKGGLNKKNKKKKKKVKVGFDGGSGKKRGGGGGGLLLSPPRCQAEKCEADLTEAKRYYRRHKVCELHAKATAAIVAGLRQRFCQQCSRRFRGGIMTSEGPGPGVTGCRPDLTQPIGRDPPLGHQWSSSTASAMCQVRAEYSTRSPKRATGKTQHFVPPRNRTWTLAVGANAFSTGPPPPVVPYVNV